MRWLLRLLVAAVVLAAIGAGLLRQADQYRQDGTLRLETLQAPVRVVRDEQGIPYIFAASLEDAIRAQGFVTAQDRLLQIELSRYLSQGRLAELIGAAGLKSDIPLRVVGISRHARRHAQLLGARERRWRELYLEGLNAYIREQRADHPVGLRLLGITARAWTLEDSVTLSYFLNWTTSANLTSELIAQMLIDRLGPERAAEIAQLTINPDNEDARSAAPVTAAAGLALSPADLWFGFRPLQIGSNQWVMGGARSAGGAPVLANDPHLDSRTLPGIWHPVGLVTPQLRAVGVAGPGLPGLAVARTDRIAYGATNAYGDVMDLYIEREDPARPGHYLEGGVSLPFEVIEEVIRIRDRGSNSGYREVPLTIRLTRRGPVISDHGMGVAEGSLISLRWAVPEAMRPDDSSGTDLLLARSVEEARQTIGRINAPYNYVVADVEGNIAHFTAGRVPIRLRGDGSAPQPVSDSWDSWAGMIPWTDMPGTTNPARGWVGNANHRTLPADFAYPYSSYFAPSWRYRRMVELLDGPDSLSAEDHWRFLWDRKNAMAARIAPVMAGALTARPDTRRLGEILSAWDFTDDPELTAPAIFQAAYRHFARLTFEDELGAGLASRMLEHWYYWQERFYQLARDNGNQWFDDVATTPVETRDDIIHQAALLAQRELTERLGPDPEDWRWGRVHTVTFFSPTMPGKWVATLLGGGTRSKDGSGETLNRGIYKWNDPYEAVVIASLRFVADLSDPDKVMAVLPGGASGRQFSAHLRDQIEPWLTGEVRHWWFSDMAIREHQIHELTLTP